MARSMQFRCPGCLKLLFKWVVGQDSITKADESIKFIDGTHDVICPKCKVRSEVTKAGLRKIDLIKVERDTLVGARPA
jgi:Zn finger protein HypA/HybF involved in hydrogenase expression